MALDTFDTIWRAVLLRCPLASAFLARQWVTYSFRSIVEKRKWSWLIKRSQFLVNTQYNTGTVTATFGSSTIVGTGTAWTTQMVGRQFRVSVSAPIYTITSINVGAQTLVLDDLFGFQNFSGGYTIWNQLFTPPSDYHAIISIWDPAFNWQLWTHIKQEELNSWDAQRAQQGTAWVLADGPGYDTTVSPPLPKFELWPNQLVQKPYPYLYESRPPDLDDANATLPRYITGDVLLEGALAQAAKWPGPSSDQKNPMFNLALAQMHEAGFRQRVAELERQDDEVYANDVQYQMYTGLPFAPLPLGDAAWLQSHAV